MSENTKHTYALTRATPASIQYPVFSIQDSECGLSCFLLTLRVYKRLMDIKIAHIASTEEIIGDF